MQTHEEKKERMRAYYQANKDKWKKYNRDALTRMSDDEKNAYKEKRRENYKAYYKAHREKVLKRTTQYQRNHKDKIVTYRAEWFQSNKQKIAARRRLHYHKVVKPRRKESKAHSEFVTISEAVKILGAKIRTFREWVYQGRIESVKTPGGRYLLRRADVEEIQSNIEHIPERIRTTLGLWKKGDTA